MEFEIRCKPAAAVIVAKPIYRGLSPAGSPAMSSGLPQPSTLNQFTANSAGRSWRDIGLHALQTSSNPADPCPDLLQQASDLSKLGAEIRPVRVFEVEARVAAREINLCQAGTQRLNLASQIRIPRAQILAESFQVVGLLQKPAGPDQLRLQRLFQDFGKLAPAHVVADSPRGQRRQLRDEPRIPAQGN